MDFQEMAKDPYNLPEETKILQQLDSLERQAHAGALFEDLRRHPAWQKVEEYMKNYIEESQKKIFQDADGDHRKAIFQVQGMVQLRNWIHGQSLAGQIASRAIAEHFKAVAEEKRSLGINE
jgi:hypothetical protein